MIFAVVSVDIPYTILISNVTFIVVTTIYDLTNYNLILITQDVVQQER